MIVAMGKIRFPSDRAEEMRAASADAQAFCQQLPGCRGFELGLSSAHEGVLLATEVWDSEEAFVEHIELSNANPDLAPWRELVRGMEIRTFEATERPDPDISDTTDRLNGAETAR